MKICKRAIDFVQIINDDGDVRLCSWQKDGGVIGRITQKPLEEIYNGPAATLIKKRHAAYDYTACDPNACPYVENENWDDIMVEIDEFPKYPRELYLAYENICNYHCGMCTVPGCVNRDNMEEHERKMNIIDEEIKNILPYVKHISANGLGELFASPHIMKLLAEWKPVSDKDECRVTIETNGALFNEANWKKIENIGQYHLSVCITVLSFDNDIYRELSGTALPITNLENNLRFVKSLREKGIINYLELATVYQEKNFKKLPEFSRRCIEEFGADYVRLRPFEPWRDPDFHDWYRDVRNEYHPRHQEFLEVMKHPYLKHPKVHDWGGGKVSGLGPNPYPRTIMQFNMISGIYREDFLCRLNSQAPNGRIAVYAMHTVGKVLADYLSNNMLEFVYGIDKKMAGQTFLDKPIYSPNELEKVDKEVTVIVALDRYEEAIEEFLHEIGYQNVCTLKSLSLDE